MITIALSKGRVSKTFIKLLIQMGYEFPQDIDRQLQVTDSQQQISLVLVKAFDVPIYVEKSVAELGIVGNDILLEENFNVFELLDLGFANCKMCLAGPRQMDIKSMSWVRIASKYPHITQEYLKKQNIQGNVIKLNGSVELAPLVGISDFIVDLVESGRTLADNGLIIYETLESISSRLIANKVTYKTKFDEIQNFITTVERFQNNTAEV